MTDGMPSGVFAAPDESRARIWRAALFYHLDGLALTILVPTMHAVGMLGAFEDRSEWDLGELAAALGVNGGYLNVLCRLLASQGLLVRAADDGRVRYAVADTAGWAALQRDWVHMKVGRRWLAEAEGMWNRSDQPMEAEAAVAMRNLIRVLDQLPEGPQRQHLEGALLAPWMVTLGMQFGTEPLADWAGVAAALSGLHPSRSAAAFEVLQARGMMGTEVGAFYLARAAAYGVTTSYIRTFLWSDELLQGDGGRLWRTEPGEAEIHVDRKLNVWGSGGAHGAYFTHLDEVVRTVFDGPLDGQPKGLCDMGCGNGALLLHLHEFIRKQTLRGQHLDTHPLVLVGADFNQAALDATARHFAQEGVEGHFLWGDIGDPDRLDGDLRDRHGLALGDLLNVRSFLDHNRVFNRPKAVRSVPALTTGAYAFRGERLRPADVEQSLKEHFLKWRPHVARHGLLVIELHTMSPGDAASRLGKVPATAYDATHGFSDQYIVEVPVFDAMAAEAGLKRVDAVSRTFPRALPATVSLRYFLGA